MELDVKYIVNLARINLSAQELEKYASQLKVILDYIHQLKKVNIEAVEPTSHAVSLKNVYRQDEVKPSLASESCLANAAKRKDKFFKVPKVIE
jgi:aspartyl-tRNA(Asn)/glutamyl-tRNA(Gln) amidotransferase subunit C